MDQKERVFQNLTPPDRRSLILALVGFIGLPLLVGLAGSSFTTAAIRDWYPSLLPPPGRPPNWLFAPVWTALYIAIGVAAWRVWRQPLPNRRPLRLWGWQLLLNALWTPVFFGLHSPALGLLVILPLLVMIVLTMRAFAPLDRPAAWLLAPYLAWTCYATYLNAGFWWLNRV